MVRQKRVAEEYLSHNLDEGHWGYLVPFLPRAAARHMVTTKSQEDFFSRNLFCRLAAAASRHFSDLRRYRDTTIGSVAILGEFPPNSRELLPNSIAKFFASSPRWARVLHLRLSTSGT